MSSIIRVEVTLPYTTNLPRDIAMNVFHFTVPDEYGEGDFIAIAEALEEFYNDNVDGSNTNIARLISPVVSRGENACSMVFSDVQMDPSLPLFQADWTLGAPIATSSLPLEVALCLSIRATPAIPVPIRRRTGRIYLGPLVTTISQTPANEMPNVSSALRGQLALACQRLIDPETLDAQAWSIYSRVDDAAYEVSGGWIDNEFDTQRRRAQDPTARTVWTAP